MNIWGCFSDWNLGGALDIPAV